MNISVPVCAGGSPGHVADEVRLTKKMLRSKILSRLKTQKEEARKFKSGEIQKKLFRMSVFKKARAVMFYIAVRGEVDTDEMIQAARKSGKIVTVPVCSADRVTIRPCVLEDTAALKEGPYGVREPVNERYVSLHELDVIVVPGLAFDRKGNRLGRGKGCYDRFLRRLSNGTTFVGVAFDFQILPLVPTAAHDVSVHKVISA